VYQAQPAHSYRAIRLIERNRFGGLIGNTGGVPQDALPAIAQHARGPR
jgi:hypothetical protein